jgi:hypothetical protein
MLFTRVNNDKTYLLFAVSVLAILAFSFINLKNYFTHKKILGIESYSNIQSNYWTGFLKQNPNYIPGLLETESLEKARQIDPNFQLEPGN